MAQLYCSSCLHMLAGLVLKDLTLKCREVVEDSVSVVGTLAAWALVGQNHLIAFDREKLQSVLSAVDGWAGAPVDVATRPSVEVGWHMTAIDRWVDVRGAEMLALALQLCLKTWSPVCRQW